MDYRECTLAIYEAIFKIFLCHHYRKLTIVNSIEKSNKFIKYKMD